jgi:IS5 family transposase
VTPGLERSPGVHLDFTLFCGLDLHAAIPDETTHFQADVRF